MNLQQKSLIVGALIGAVVGAVAGLLFSRGLDLPRSGAPETSRAVPPADIAKLGLSVMGVLRGVAELGQRI